MEKIIVDEFVMGDMSYSDDMGYMGDMVEMTESTQQVSMGDKLMSSPIFVGGVTAAVLAFGVLLGIFSAKRRIKKGIDLYED